MKTGIEAYVNTLAKVEAYARRPFNAILELGTGSGEFAITAAKKGYHVTAVELVPSLVKHMEKLQKKHMLKGDLTSICGEFYQIELNQTFDMVCYLDGFGTGDDQDQKRLLQRISKWLKSDGCVFIDIYTPWYWSKHAGQEIQFGSLSRKYDYDFARSRMLDSWFDEKNNPLRNPYDAILLKI